VEPPVFVDRNSSTATATASGQPPTGRLANGERLRPRSTLARIDASSVVKKLPGFEPAKPGGKPNLLCALKDQVETALNALETAGLLRKGETRQDVYALSMQFFCLTRNEN